MAEETSTRSNSEDSTDSISQKESTIDSRDEGEAFNYDDILEHVGQLGKYQLRTFLLLCLPAFFPGIVVMSYTFTGAVPNYRCYIENCDADYSASETNSPIWLNNTIPWNDDNTPDQCQRYNYTWTNVEECQAPGAQMDSEITCDRWVYDTSQFQSTIVSDFDLTCEDEWKTTFASTVYMFGMLIGAAILGNIADAVGRRLAFTLNVFFLAAVTTGLAFSPNFVTFCVLRFFCGVCAVGHFLILFVWGVEAVGKKYRVICGFVYQLVFTVGTSLLGLLAYYVRDWQTLQLIISAPMFALVALYWIVPESIRWLIIKKRFSEARLLILKCAQMNKKSVPNHLITIPDDKKEDGKEIDTVHTKENISQADANGENKEELAKSFAKGESIIDVFRSPILLKRLIIMFLAWIAAVMGYYGITFSATNLSDDFYLNYELSMVVEIPAYIGGMFVMDKLGRRPTLSGGLIISGIACLITGLVPEEPPALRITFSMFGKLFISCVLATVYSYTSDLFPTPARSAAVGLCSTSGRVGGILAPIIASAGRKVDPALPFIIFAGVNISVGVLCLLLPETNKITLPATVQEAVDMEKYTFSCLQCNKNKREESPDDLAHSLP
ncbi:organic cation transporter protein-like [Daphnia pulicaria]|uniref:organic cation transporter protein-like n=1 Tax=Daphnia pulicaria TaxID=35523 RepID=UPI001EEC44A3|nr:organic cation transporter protein-like [Daphnia pulicaria]